MENKTSNRATKRTQHRPASSSTEPPFKQPKTSWGEHGEWFDDTVSTKKLDREYGVSSAKAIHRLQEQKCDIEDIIRRVENTSQLSPFGLETINFHASFKAALKDMLTDITEVPHKIHLIHGVPKIGKTSLAMCLSYYLALEGDSAAFVTTSYTPDTDSDRAVQALCEYTHLKWVIVDQCDVNGLNQQKLQHFITVSGVKRLVIFTSGLYVPTDSWMNSPFIKAKVISMHADKDAIDQLKTAYGLGEECDLTKEDVLQVSPIYGHICEFLQEYNTYKEANPEDKCTIQTLKQAVYRVDDMVMLSDKYNFFWLLWPNLAVEQNTESLDDDEVEWAIEPWQISVLYCRLSELTDAQDKCINAIMNWMDITKTQEEDTEQQKEDERSGYFKYKGTSYRYYFPHFDILKPILVAAFKKCTQRKLHESFLDLFNRVHTIGASTQKLRGMLFENLIRGVCALPPEQKGVYALHPHALLVPVEKVIGIHTVETLCTQADQFLKDDRNENMFCVLNVPGKHEFKGYDFAFIHGVNKEIQLLKASVNPVSQSKTTMKSTLAEIEQFKFTDHNVKVVACFIVPAEYKISIVDNFRLAPLHFSLAL